MAGTPLGITAVRSCAHCQVNRNLGYRVFILIFTFFIYTTYHLSRKPISVVKSVLHPNCSTLNLTPPVNASPNWCSWPPFDQSNSDELLGSLDYAFLFAYAVGMFISGHIAERMDLRYYLTIGMLGSGLFCAAFGFGRFWGIHSLGFYVGVQVVAGLFQSSGWPSVVTCVANWFGKGKRGFIMGVWNSHTSVGNILGSVIAGAFVTTNWGWSFAVPGMIIAGMGLLVFFFLVPTPDLVGCAPPDHHGNKVAVTCTEDESSPLVASDDDPPVQKQDQPPHREEKAISLFAALKIPGVVEFSLCLFFAKLVSYTFLFWLPKYIKNTTTFNAEQAADLSTFFDVGGIAGGIAAGVFSDYTGARALTCVVMLVTGAPVLFVYEHFGNNNLGTSIGLLLLTGALVNGPYALITTAVSADLGTHKSLQGSSKALATVTAIIDGTGSMGAALGPLFTGLLSNTGWMNVFYMLIAADVCAMLLLSRLVYKEVKVMTSRQRGRPEVTD